VASFSPIFAHRAETARVRAAYVVSVANAGARYNLSELSDRARFLSVVCPSSFLRPSQFRFSNFAVAPDTCICPPPARTCLCRNLPTGQLVRVNSRFRRGGSKPSGAVTRRRRHSSNKLPNNLPNTRRTPLLFRASPSRSPADRIHATK